MSEIELFVFILCDTFFSNLVFTIIPELAAWAAPKLSSLPHYAIYSACFLGVFFASICNYIFGIILQRVFSSLTEDNENAVKNSSNLNSFMKNFGHYLLVLSFVPIYSKFIIILAGFTRFNFFASVAITTFMKTVFYAFA